MHTFIPDPTKLFYSRLRCWGALSVSFVAFVVCNLIPLDAEIILLWYLSALLAGISPFIVWDAESDYGRHFFTLSPDSIKSGEAVIAHHDLDDFVWQIAPFPQTDNGGCRFVKGDSVIEIRFKFLSNDSALTCLQKLRESVPAEKQRNWPQFCHTTAVRLLNEIRHPDRELPPPEDTEVAPLIESNQRRCKFLLLIIVGGFVLALGCGAILEWLGITNAMLWSLGIFVVVKMLAQASAATNQPIVERKFLTAQQIWDSEVMNISAKKSNGPL